MGAGGPIFLFDYDYEYKSLVGGVGCLFFFFLLLYTTMLVPFVNYRRFFKNASAFSMPAAS